MTDRDSRIGKSGAKRGALDNKPRRGARSLDFSLNRRPTLPQQPQDNPAVLEFLQRLKTMPDGRKATSIINQSRFLDTATSIRALKRIENPQHLDRALNAVLLEAITPEDKNRLLEYARKTGPEASISLINHASRVDTDFAHRVLQENIDPQAPHFPALVEQVARSYDQQNFYDDARDVLDLLPDAPQRADILATMKAGAPDEFKDLGTGYVFDYRLQNGTFLAYRGGEFFTISTADGMSDVAIHSEDWGEIETRPGAEQIDGTGEDLIELDDEGAGSINIEIGEQVEEQSSARMLLNESLYFLSQSSSNRQVLEGVVGRERVGRVVGKPQLESLGLSLSSELERRTSSEDMPWNYRFVDRNVLESDINISTNLLELVTAIAEGRQTVTVTDVMSGDEETISTEELEQRIGSQISVSREIIQQHVVEVTTQRRNALIEEKIHDHRYADGLRQLIQQHLYGAEQEELEEQTAPSRRSNLLIGNLRKSPDGDPGTVAENMGRVAERREQLRDQIEEDADVEEEPEEQPESEAEPEIQNPELVAELNVTQLLGEVEHEIGNNDDFSTINGFYNEALERAERNDSQAEFVAIAEHAARSGMARVVYAAYDKITDDEQRRKIEDITDATDEIRNQPRLNGVRLGALELSPMQSGVLKIALGKETPAEKIESFRKALDNHTGQNALFGPGKADLIEAEIRRLELDDPVPVVRELISSQEVQDVLEKDEQWYPEVELIDDDEVGQQMVDLEDTMHEDRDSSRNAFNERAMRMMAENISQEVIAELQDEIFDITAQAKQISIYQENIPAVDRVAQAVAHAEYGQASVLTDKEIAARVKFDKKVRKRLKKRVRKIFEQKKVAGNITQLMAQDEFLRAHGLDRETLRREQFAHEDIQIAAREIEQDDHYRVSESEQAVQRMGLLQFVGDPGYVNNLFNEIARRYCRNHGMHRADFRRIQGLKGEEDADGRGRALREHISQRMIELIEGAMASQEQAEQLYDFIFRDHYARLEGDVKEEFVVRLSNQLRQADFRFNRVAEYEQHMASRPLQISNQAKENKVAAQHMAIFELSRASDNHYTPEQIQELFTGDKSLELEIEGRAREIMLSQDHEQIQAQALEFAKADYVQQGHMSQHNFEHAYEHDQDLRDEIQSRADRIYNDARRGLGVVGKSLDWLDEHVVLSTSFRHNKGAMRLAAYEYSQEHPLTSGEIEARISRRIFGHGLRQQLDDRAHDLREGIVSSAIDSLSTRHSPDLSRRTAEEQDQIRSNEQRTAQEAKDILQTLAHTA